MLSLIEFSIAKFSDLEAILELQKESYMQEALLTNDYTIPPLMQDIDSLQRDWKKGTIIKAEIDGQIIGSVRAKLVGSICKIGKLMVKPSYQKQGIGKRLMAKIENQFDMCTTYELFTGYKSEGNLNFYTSLGYESCSIEPVDAHLKLIYLQKQRKKKTRSSP